MISCCHWLSALQDSHSGVRFPWRSHNEKKNVFLAASYCVPQVSCSRVGLKPAGLSPWLVSGCVSIRVPLLLLTSRCSAVMKRRLLLLREVACRSSKEKAAPHVGDQSVRRRRGEGGARCFLTAEDRDTPGGTACPLCSGTRCNHDQLCDRRQGHRTLWYSQQDGKLPCLASVMRERIMGTTSGQSFQNKSRVW